MQVEGAGVPTASTHSAYQSFSEISRQRKKEPSPFENPVADAFENEIACSMDALDNIGKLDDVGSPMNSLTIAAAAAVAVDDDAKEDSDSVPLVGGSSQSDFWSKFKNGRKARDVGSDEVRIMKKVLGGDQVESEECVAALSLCEWNVHHAIKLVKVKKLIRAPPGLLTDADMRVALQTRDWDVSKAASVLMKKIKE